MALLFDAKGLFDAKEPYAAKELYDAKGIMHLAASPRNQSTASPLAPALNHRRPICQAQFPGDRPGRLLAFQPPSEPEVPRLALQGQEILMLEEKRRLNPPWAPPPELERRS
jgi:hypothetical protein